MNEFKSSSGFNPLQSSHAWRALAILTIGFVATIVIFLSTVFIYHYFFLGNSKLTGEAAMAIADSPAAIAFQTLLISLVYGFALLMMLIKYRLPVKESLGLEQVGLVRIALIVAGTTGANILVDQLLFVLFDGPLKGLLPQNITYSFNLAAILGNLEQINLVSFTLLMILSLIALPVLEELLFRGVIFNSLRTQHGFIATASISAVFFSIFKLDTVLGLSSFATSLIYARIMEKTCSIFPCILSRVAACWLTFELSRLGLAYGVGGISYPTSYIVISFIALIVGLLTIELTGKPGLSSRSGTVP